MHPRIRLNVPTAPKPPEPPPEPKSRGPLFWFVQVLLFPFRLMGLLLLVLLIPGIVQMWQLPNLAENNKLDLTLLALRALNEEKAVRPLQPLGYRAITQERIIDISDDGNYLDKALMIISANEYRVMAVGNKASRTPSGEYEYVITYNYCPPRTVTAKSPHLHVSPDELAQARKAIDRLFPKKQERTEVLEWGESLFWTEWLRKNSFFDVEKKFVPEPLGGSEDERLWFAWQVLRGTCAAADDDLPRLPQLFEQAFPKAEDQAAALQWAQRLYEHLESDFNGYEAAIKAHLIPSTGPDIHAWDAPYLTRQEYAGFKRVLPPKTRWTYQWLVYRYAGLTEASRATARQHWLSHFPAEAEERVLAFGREVEAERRAAGEPLPPVPETLPLLCVAERLVGSDPYGQRCQALLKKVYGSDDNTALAFGIMSSYPNDDIFYLHATRDALQMSHIAHGEHTLPKRLEYLVGTALVPLIGSLGFITLLNWVVAPLLLRKGVRPLWKKYRAGCGKEPLWLWVVSVVFFAGIACLSAPYTLATVVYIQTGSYEDLFLGALAATAIGGMLIGNCRRILAFLLVQCGVDVEETWIDTIVGFILGGLILYHFGNDVFSIVLFGLSDFVPSLLYEKLILARAKRGKAAEQALQPAGTGSAAFPAGRTRLTPS
jgi:hypothetical protein